MSTFFAKFISKVHLSRMNHKKYVYIWADCVYFNNRNDDAKQSTLVIVGVTKHGRKEFIAIEDECPKAMESEKRQK